jgi:hypothetical protein
MREVESSYRQFPTAIELPATLPAHSMKDWLANQGLRFNYDYICIQALIGRESVGAYAFRNRAHALMFKMAFAGT